jgi:hypothetical protein
MTTVSGRPRRSSGSAADAVLIATPEYNGSIPGGLKNAVDWASRPFPDNAWRDRPVAVIGASTGIFGAVWAQAELRKSPGIAGARVIDAELAVGGAHDAFLPSGALRDPGLATGLRDVVAALVDAQPEREPELAGRAAAREGAEMSELSTILVFSLAAVALTARRAGAACNRGDGAQAGHRDPRRPHPPGGRDRATRA